MLKKNSLKPVCAAMGAAFVVSLTAAPVVNAAENPFSMTELSSGYMVADAHEEGKCGEGKADKAEGNCGENKKAEGKCGEGKCGEKMKAEGKCGEGKCGENKKAEGKCGEGKADKAEGKCGEGKAE